LCASPRRQRCAPDSNRDAAIVGRSSAARSGLCHVIVLRWMVRAYGPTPAGKGGRRADGCRRSSTLAPPDHRPSAQTETARRRHARRGTSAVRPRIGLHAVGRVGHDRSPRQRRTRRRCRRDARTCSASASRRLRSSTRRDSHGSMRFRLPMCSVPFLRPQHLRRLASSRCDPFLSAAERIAGPASPPAAAWAMVRLRAAANGRPRHRTFREDD
jgi:hypothetical protein